jgi:DNA polymerase-3 subunit epsilon
MAKQLYPGKRNSLDALCERLGVDNSSRTLHGALLDAELLADVYIALTRGQEMLLEEEHGPSGNQVPLADYRGLKLVVIEPNAQELQAHAQMLTEIDKASGGKTLWRTFENQGADEANGTSTVA